MDERCVTPSNSFHFGVYLVRQFFHNFSSVWATRTTPKTLFLSNKQAKAPVLLPSTTQAGLPQERTTIHLTTLTTHDKYGTRGTHASFRTGAL